MQSILPLETEKVYHIYNRGIDSCDILIDSQDVRRFMATYAKYLGLYVDTLAYALMKNHFHFLIRVKDLSEDEEFINYCKEHGLVKPPNVSRQFGHFFNSYAQYFNKRYSRTGALFERAFKRKLIEHDDYFVRAVLYIHANPVHHGLVDDLTDYPNTTYHALISEKPTKLCREEVLEWFGGREEFISFHQRNASEYLHDEYVIE